MSKSTKIIAALGVVAGLGVAALPAFTYAAQTPASTTGDVDVIVEVQPAIALAISGNNDDGVLSGDGAFAVQAVTSPSGNPSSQGWYEESGTSPDIVYVLTTDTEVASGKTYYEYTGGYREVDSFAPASAKNSIIDGHPTPAGSIIGPSSSYLSLLPNTAGSVKSTVNVYTNNTSGYTLSVRANGSDAAMHQQVATGVGDTIAAIANTPAIGTPGWAYKVADVTEEAPATSKTNKGVITTGYESDSQMGITDQVIVTSQEKTAEGDDWDVTYDVATKADQATGIYKVSLTYTAATRNGS